MHVRTSDNQNAHLELPERLLPDDELGDPDERLRERELCELPLLDDDLCK